MTSPMSAFERYLSLWVVLCIVAGVVLGNLFPGLFQVVSAWEYASVNLVVAVLIWAMVYPHRLVLKVEHTTRRNTCVKIDAEAIVKIVDERPSPVPAFGVALAFQQRSAGTANQISSPPRSAPRKPAPSPARLPGAFAREW